jgi:hypothetical protein
MIKIKMMTITIIGFTEGDGSFIVNSRGTPIFVITQSTTDVQIINLGLFG